MHSPAVVWNRIRYTLWAPVYDRVAEAAGFNEARGRSIARLQLNAGDRVLVIGAGTGLDLPHLPDDVEITAIDVTPAMLARLQARAVGRGASVTTHIMDARKLDFPDAFFDGIVMHLILAVMPNPGRGLAEAERVLRPGRRIAVFDKFLRDTERPTARRRILNAIAKPLFSDMNRRLGSLVAGTRLVLEHDDPVAFGGMYRIATLKKGS